MTTNRRSFLFSCASAPLAALAAARSTQAWVGLDLSHHADFSSEVYCVLDGDEVVYHPGRQVWIDECHKHKDRALYDAIQKAEGALHAFQTTGRQTQIALVRMKESFRIR